METSSFIETVMQQSAIVALMGFIAFTLWKKLEEQITKKDSLAEALIKITLLWEERYSKDSRDDLENKVVLNQILDIIREIRDGK